jgi:hypothetical protein
MESGTQEKHARMTSYPKSADLFIPTPEGMKALADHHERMMGGLWDLLEQEVKKN